MFLRWDSTCEIKRMYMYRKEKVSQDARLCIRNVQNSNLEWRLMCILEVEIGERL